MYWLGWIPGFWVVGWAIKFLQVRVVGFLPLGQFGQFHFSFLILNAFIYSFLYFVMHLDFHCQIYLFIYSLNHLFLNFWYFFIHIFNWLPQSKILFIYSACVSDLFACLFAFSTVLCLSFCPRLVYVCTYVGLYMCMSVCFCIYNILLWMSLHKLSNDWGLTTVSNCFQIFL